MKGMSMNEGSAGPVAGMGTVLLAEDGDVQARLILAVLGNAGFAVERVGDGLAAYERIKAGPPPPLLVTDLLMPGLSGFELLARLSTEGLLPPTIVLTSRSDEESVLRSLGYGALDCIQKPFSPSVLLARIKIALKSGTGGGTP